MKSADDGVVYTNISFVESGNTVDDIISYAKNYLGSPYRYGGRSSKGFDCSGFVSYVLGNFGISVSRSSSSMANNGVAVDKSELQKGDLLFFATTRGSGRVSHVGMYIGDGQFIHSSTWGKGVVITDLSDAYYTRCFVKAKRVL
jgi:cell wall-associated NlpC family hydrolase